MRTPSFPQAIPVDPATVPADQLRHLPRDQRPAPDPDESRFHASPGRDYRIAPVTVMIELDGLIPLRDGFPSVVDDAGDVRFLNNDGVMDWLVLSNSGVEFSVEYH